MLALLSAVEVDSDRLLLQDLYDRYANKMYRVALHILKSPALAEDAVHDSFLKLIRHLEEIRKIPCNEMEPYIVTIVKRTALDSLKREKRLSSLDENWDAPTAADRPESEDAYHRLVALIRSMPDTYRSVLELKFVLEWSNKEIAKSMGLTENTVAVRLMRGRALLKGKLEEEGY